MTWAACTAWVRSSYEKDEPVFHEPWEGRVYAMSRALGRLAQMDARQLPAWDRAVAAEEYLRSSYYERWFSASFEQVLSAGFVTADEVAQRPCGRRAVPATPALTVEMVPLGVEPQDRVRG